MGEFVFTDFVRLLEAGASPGPAIVDRVLGRLRAALAAEIRRRGLWDSPPRYLGVYGSTRWREALDELAADCFSFVFVDRLRGLAAQLRVKPNVDGIVFLNVQHFVHETQKRHDPVGFRVFVVLQAALRRLLEAGGLHLWSGDARVRNDTVLGFGRARAGPACSAEELKDPVARWADDLMPDLVTARGEALDATITRLERHVAALNGDGVLAFRFKSLVDRLKAEVHARWVAGRESGDDRLGTAHVDSEWSDLVARLPPPSAFEERQSFARLQEDVTVAIEGLPQAERTKGYLRRLFGYLVRYAEDAPDGVGEREDEQGLPSHRQLARVLDIPRERLPGLFETLGRLIGERTRRGLAETGRAVPRAPEGQS